jgi:hypothetical protein
MIGTSRFRRVLVKVGSSKNRRFKLLRRIQG